MDDHHHEDRGRRKDVRIDTKPRIMTGTPSPEEKQPASGTAESIPKKTWRNRIRFPGGFDWIKDHWNWPSLKPVIRCAISAWVSVVLFVIPAVEIWLGQAAFLIMIAAFLSPPLDPFVAVLEREFRIVLFVCIAWAWSCLGLKLASLSRSDIDYTVGYADVFAGKYVEAAPSAIIGVFIALGTMFFLFIRAHQGPGPFFFASIFGCICLDVVLTTAALFPYPYYELGKAILVPIGIHSAVALVMSLLVFPLTISSQYKSYIRAVHAPLSSALSQHASLLALPAGSAEFDTLVETIDKTVKKSDVGLAGIAATGRLLQNDLTYCRFSPEDFLAFQGFARQLAARVQGLGVYFTLIDASKHGFPMTPGTSVPGTPAPGSPSRGMSPVRGQEEGGAEDFVSPSGSDPESAAGTSRHSPEHSGATPNQIEGAHAGKHQHHKHQHQQHHHGVPRHILHKSLAKVSAKTRRRKTEHVVGVFESQKYLNLEAKHWRDPRHDEWAQMETELLGQGCVPLLTKCSESLAGIDGWLERLGHGKFGFFRRKKHATERARTIETLVEYRDTLSTALKQFRERDRMLVIEPYRPEVENADDDDSKDVGEVPPHRHLFHCYIYQYHLIQVAQVILAIIDEIIRLDGERKRYRLWTPASKMFHWTAQDLSHTADHDEDDDPDIIQGAHRIDGDDLGMAKRRDPDALPPRNAVEWVMNLLYHAGNALTGGNALFAIKAGIITGVLCLPSLIRGSARFAYENRWVWGIIMAQFTLARFRGDTTFGLASRISATFVGCIIGAVMWYIASGSGVASPYGFAAVCAVCLPIFFMIWLYAPIPAMTRIMAFVTATLVIGYSYQDTHQVVPGSPGAGWNVAWRRFVLVTIGVTAAFLASLLPPTMTLRRYQRSLLSTTSTELGAIYCSIISFATERNEADGQAIIASLVATRSKLSRSTGLLTNIMYEFSLRGRWPKKRYQQILDLQIAISHSLSHLLSVTEHLEPAWTRAFLRRTRFLDPDFQGDVLAVISMVSSSLRTGSPLPQVTPAPLLDRFMLRPHGLDVIHRDSEEDFGLPRLLTIETLQDEQYMMFCVGIAAAYSIMIRLDRLMVATKEIVGEQYHIHGIGVRPNGMAPLSANASFSERPLKDV